MSGTLERANDLDGCSPMDIAERFKELRKLLDSIRDVRSGADSKIKEAANERAIGNVSLSVLDEDNVACTTQPRQRPGSIGVESRLALS